jgi:hypothetical protein
VCHVVESLWDAAGIRVGGGGGDGGDGQSAAAGNQQQPTSGTGTGTGSDSGGDTTRNSELRSDACKLLFQVFAHLEASTLARVFAASKPQPQLPPPLAQSL